MWGANSDCRLMTDENENKFVPSLTKLEKLQKNDENLYEPYILSLGVTHSAVITRNGELFTGGSKLDGQLGFKYQNPNKA
jgi:alpha-tubulin suppressor-like RCC1 family protein